MRGLDKYISDQLNVFNAKLWPALASAKKGYYGRAYKHLKNDVRLAFVYDKDNEYQDVTFNDNLSASLFFDIGDNENGNYPNFTAEVSIVVMVNLYDIYPTAVYRAIEDVHNDVLSLIKKCGVFKITGVTTGENVFGNIDTTLLKQYDMQPFHVFRVNCQAIGYNKNCNYTN